MSLSVEYLSNTASVEQITEHLLRCDAHYLPALSSRVQIDDYSQRIANKAVRFEAWSAGTLVGLVAAYFNSEDKCTAYITNVSVLREWTGKGIARRLMNRCVEHAKASGIRRISLEVARDNTPAIRLYEKGGFIANESTVPLVPMNLYIRSDDSVNSDRDYNVEMQDAGNHKYAYGFDLDVMHPFMIRAFTPFFIKGGLLELGSYKGDLTRRFLPFFDDITCVEASDAALAEARNKLGSKVNYVNSLAERATLPRRFENIVLTHVLEHLDDPVLVLRRVNDEWLTESGRFLLVCPNANAPSRQIAVKMGLISHNAAVTPAEAEHGHRRTYTLDTLERDAVAAGLKVIHRSGIFFKALANFQWDRLLQTDIISVEYLDGCYKLGQQYPDLCSSIFLVCERGATPKSRST